LRSDSQKNFFSQVVKQKKTKKRKNNKRTKNKKSEKADFFRVLTFHCFFFSFCFRVVLLSSILFFLLF